MYFSINSISEEFSAIDFSSIESSSSVSTIFVKASLSSSLTSLFSLSE